MNVLSQEQQDSVAAVRDGHSLIIDAVAGSGKTTTVLGLAKDAPDKKIIQLTYNKFLKFEVRKRAEQEGCTNLDVQTYHSLFVKYYSKTAYTDSALQQILREKRKPQRKIKAFDVLVIDEAQDMTPVYFCMVQKFLRDSGCTPQLVFLGDQYQAIYEFKGSDARFLTLARECWPSYTIQKLPLHTSYRLTQPMATFLNEAILGLDRIHAMKPGPPVEYIRENLFNPSYIYSTIQSAIASGLKPDELFILGPSVRSKSGSTLPIQYLENKLVKDGIPCYVAGETEEDIDETIIKGKVVFSTFHQAKGRERPFVVVYGFDANWYEYYGKGLDTSICSNELYVALTRASHRLLLVEGASNQKDKTLTVPCLKMSIAELQKKPYVRFHGPWHTSAVQNQTHGGSGEQSKKTSVTDLTKFISEEYLDALTQLKDQLFTQQTPAQFSTTIPSVVPGKDGLSESVSDLNGVAIPLYWDALRHAGHSRIQECLMTQEYQSVSPIVRQYLAKLPRQCSTPADFLLLANCLQTHSSNYTFKLAQLTTYDWISDSMMEQCMFILDSQVSKDVKVEVPFQPFKYLLKGFGTLEVHAIVDAIDCSTVWEFKCVQELSLEHFLQLILYAWIWNHQYKPERGARSFRLLNIRTGESYELDTTSHWIDEVAETLLQNKFLKKCKISSKQFLEWCRSQTSPTGQDEEEGTEPPLNLNTPVEKLNTADPTIDIELYTVPELIQQCKMRGLFGCSALSKEELCAALKGYDSGVPQYKFMKTTQLKAILQERGHENLASKSKAELLALLETPPLVA
jgi:hypothetical protein